VPVNARQEGNRFLETALKAAGLSRRVLIEHLGKLSGSDISRKRAADFVTRADRESQQIILSTIKEAFPGHGFLAEEAPEHEADSEFRWIIDPLDGTTNYIHGYPVFSVSIALEREGEIMLGVVSDPTREEVFTALKGAGAFLNGRPIRVSSVSSMEESLITTGFPFRQKDFIDIYLKAFKNVFLRASGIRRAGSAAIDLAYVAAGRCEGFFEVGLSPWDVAAGAALIREAGGAVTDFGGGGDYLTTGNIVAGNPAVHAEVLGEIRGVFGGVIDR
jgi:myo-inositol-1(or 4)-monophosphatase